MDGFLGALFSPGKSAFLYDLLLILFVVVAVICWKRINSRQQATILAKVGCMVLTWVGYARFYVWSGDPAWGNRYGATAVYVGILLTFPLWIRFFRPIQNVALTALLQVTLGLVFLLQIISLVYPAWVEMVQAGYNPGDWAQVTWGNSRILGWHADTFRLGQRVMNIAAHLTGHFVDWGLDRTRDGKIVGPHPPILVPFQPLTSFSPTLRIVVRLIWWAATAALLALVWNLTTLSRKSHRGCGVGDKQLGTA
ncbi:MAG: hypothetical protein EXS36_17890 [Pedosphaera sp.]|nr:hypothetical protein [Pedosphaera sp.]